MDWDLIRRLMNCFDFSFINQCGEFIVHKEANEYFILRTCNDELDIKCKMLEWLSRSAHKGCYTNSEKKNIKLQDFILRGINDFLGTEFTKKEMEQIYSYLGNACNHEKTIKFIKSGYDMNILIS